MVESRRDAVALGSSISVAAPFVRRCLTGSTVAPFSHPAHRPGQADFPHPAHARGSGASHTPPPSSGSPPSRSAPAHRATIPGISTQRAVLIGVESHALFGGVGGWHDKCVKAEQTELLASSARAADLPESITPRPSINIRKKSRSARRFTNTKICLGTMFMLCSYVQAAPLHADAGSTFRDRLARIQTRVNGRLKLGLHAKFTRYGLCRDLALPITNPSAKIPIAVRPLQDTDLGLLFSVDCSRDPAEKLELAWRRAFVDKGAQRRLRGGRPTQRGAVLRTMAPRLAEQRFYSTSRRVPGTGVPRSPAGERLYAARLPRARDHVGRHGADCRARHRGWGTSCADLRGSAQYRFAEGLPARRLSSAAAAPSDQTLLRTDQPRSFRHAAQQRSGRTATF